MFLGTLDNYCKKIEQVQVTDTVFSRQAFLTMKDGNLLSYQEKHCISVLQSNSMQLHVIVNV